MNPIPENQQAMNRRLLDILETTSDLISTSTPDARITYLNRAGRQLLMIDPDVDLSKSEIRNLHPEWAYKEIKETGIPAALKHGSWQGNTAVCTSTGREIPVSQVILAHFDEAGELRYFSTIMRDISEQIRIKEELHQQQEYLRVIFNDSRIPLVVMDAQTEAFLDCNSAAVAVFGFGSKQELLGLNLLDLSAPVQYDGTPSTDKIHQQIQSCMQSGSHRFEWKQRRRNGELWDGVIHLMQFFHKNKPLIQFSVQDVTLEKQLEAERIALEERYSNFVKNSSEGIFCLEYRPPIEINQSDEEIIRQIEENTIISEVNDALAGMYGISREEMEGQPVIKFAPDTGRQTLALLKAPDYRVAEMEVADRRADGSTIWIVESFYAVVENGKLLRAWGVQRDITARKKAEVEKERLQQQLLHAQKMESVGRLAGGVAHDFNNMLSVILGHAEMAVDQIDPEQPLYSNLQEILKAAHRSANLTRQLLAFARKQAVHPRQVDLNATVQGMFSMLRRLIGEDIRLELVAGEQLWLLHIDPTQLDQLVVNLGVNARDAITAQQQQQKELAGLITIETANVTIGKEYADDHHGFVPGDYVALFVTDNGTGMDKETLNHLFEPFFTTKGIGEGTGLGLATVYGIVRQNNGFVNVYSEPDQGTVFRIYLPRYTGKPEQHRETADTAPEQIAGQTILLVEDEPAILTIATGMLTNAGYYILAAETPGRALELADAYNGEISLLLTDVVMPEMNGRELSGRMQHRFPQIETIYMSGYTANVIEHRGVLEKDVNFLQKPFTGRELTELVRKVLTRSRHADKNG